MCLLTIRPNEATSCIYKPFEFDIFEKTCSEASIIYLASVPLCTLSRLINYILYIPRLGFFKRLPS